MTGTAAQEHDFEPTPGLPGRLPDGEHVLWRGSPSMEGFARRFMRTRWIAVYFGVLALWAAVAGFNDGLTLGGVAFSVAVLCVLAAILIGLIELYAWGVARTTLYTITNRRVVMRIGVALSVTMNIPFREIASADIRRMEGGGGDVILTLAEGRSIAWMMLWPHARTFAASSPKPVLRCLPDLDAAAAILSTALAMEVGGGPKVSDPDARPLKGATARPAIG